MKRYIRKQLAIGPEFNQSGAFSFKGVDVYPFILTFNLSLIASLLVYVFLNY